MSIACGWNEAEEMAPRPKKCTNEHEHVISTLLAFDAS